jgi:hypothetical protein
MLKDILHLIKEEKGYVLLFLLVAALYGGFWFTYKSSPESKQPSAALEEFQKAEKKWRQKVTDTQSLERYLEKRPFLSYLFRAFSFFIVGAFSLGILIDLFLVFKPAWRRSLTRRGPPATTPWKFSMLFKVIVLWMTASLSVGLLLNFIRHFILPQFSVNFYALFHTTILDILCFVIILYVVRPYPGAWRDLGLQTSDLSIVREIGIGFTGYFAILPIFVMILIFLVLVAHFFAYEPPPHPLVEVFLEETKRSPWLVIYSIFLASMIGPVFEEIFFRGFCYPIFKNRWGVGWAMILSSAFFALIHHSQFAFWPIFVLGLALAFLYEKRGSLLAPIALHILHNTVFISYFFLAKQIVLQEGGG